MKRRFTRTPARRIIRPQIDARSAELATVGANDAKHFTRAEVVAVPVNRAELDTITAALAASSAPEAVSLLRRFRCR